LFLPRFTFDFHESFSICTIVVLHRLICPAIFHPFPIIASERFLLALVSAYLELLQFLQDAEKVRPFPEKYISDMPAYHFPSWQESLHPYKILFISELM